MSASAILVGAHGLRKDRPKVYDSPAIPTTFLIARNGVIVAAHSGLDLWNARGNVRIIQDLLQMQLGQPLPASLAKLPPWKKDPQR